MTCDNLLADNALMARGGLMACGDIRGDDAVVARRKVTVGRHIVACHGARQGS